MIVLLYDCPCCDYPTLASWGNYHICYLCWWEDDGQGENDPDEIVGGPNGDYSLREARENFANYLIMFRPSDSRFTSIRNEKIDSMKREIMTLLDKYEDPQSSRIKSLVGRLDTEVDRQTKRSEEIKD